VRVAGHAVATLCVIDPRPRPFDQGLSDALTRLARMVARRMADRQSQSITASLLRTSPDAVICSDAEQRITLWSPQPRGCSAGARRKWPGEGSTSSSPKRFKAAHHAGHARLLKGATPVLIGKTVEVPALHKDGTEFPIELSLAMWRDGEQHGVGAIARDVTERSLAQAELLRARDAAEDANRAKGEFVANMSHEIRTPLNGVLGVMDALGRTTLDAGQREMVDLVQTSAGVLERLLSDVLDFARIEAREVVAEQAPMDLREILAGAVSLFRPQADAKGVTFDVEVDGDMPERMLGDALRLKQVLYNLLSNAVKFTERGGAVALAVQRSEDQLRLTLTDTGCGFEPAGGERLFERFQQADNSTTRRYGGSGLGLPIARELAQLMGGTLRATSEPGRGSTFTLLLPFVACEASSSDAGTYTEGELAGAELKVLLAGGQSHQPARRRVDPWELGMSLVAVENGAQAVEAWAAEAFDVVLMDLHMPVMDGLSAISEIRRREEPGRPTAHAHRRRVRKRRTLRRAGGAERGRGRTRRQADLCRQAVLSHGGGAGARRAPASERRVTASAAGFDDRLGLRRGHAGGSRRLGLGRGQRLGRRGLSRGRLGRRRRARPAGAALLALVPAGQALGRLTLHALVVGGVAGGAAGAGGLSGTDRHDKNGRR
jgi:PAS domain S-box-containing protein